MMKIIGSMVLAGMGALLTMIGSAKAEGPSNRAKLVSFCGQKLDLDVKKVSCNDPTVKDLSPLKSLTKIEELNISETRVYDLTPLKTLKNLRELDLMETQVEDILPLKGLKKLKWLNLFKTNVPIKQIKEIKKAIPGLEIAGE